MEVRRQWIVDCVSYLFVLFCLTGEPSHLVHQVRPGEHAHGRAGIHGGGEYGGDAGGPQGGASHREQPSAWQRSER